MSAAARGGASRRAGGPLARATGIAIALACIVVALGAATRLVDAGLGCPDWPGCYGHLLWPSAADDIERANRAWPQAPVDTGKTWPEMVHRYAAGALLLSGVALLWLARAAGQSLALPGSLLALLLTQALFGMWTVTLKLWPQVVVVHLLGGFASLSLLCAYALQQRASPWEVSELTALRLRRLRPLAWLALACIIAQIALGGWMSANYAALACTDFPRCHGQWWPSADFAAGFDLRGPIGPSYLYGLLDHPARTAVHLTHRIGALMATLAVGALLLGLWRIQLPAARRWAGWLGAGLAVQLALGAANVLAQLPLAVAVLHNNVGAALLALAVGINYRLHTAHAAPRRAIDLGQAIA